MMRRGPLAQYPIEVLLATAASERTNGIIELHSDLEASVYLVEGEIYLAQLGDAPSLEQQLVNAGILTRAQVQAHSEPGEEGMYLALALDTDDSIDEHAIADYLFDVTAETVARFVGLTAGEYELDPYGTHPLGILVSWSPDQVFERANELHDEAERLAAEQAEAERVEAERLAAEQAEAERIEAERIEAERIETERSDAGRTESKPDRTDVVDADQVDGSQGDVKATDEPERGPIAMGPVAQESTMLVIAPDEPPDGMDPIELRPIEWRIVVLAAQGTTLESLARQLSLEDELVKDLVADLCDRGLLATVG